MVNPKYELGETVYTVVLENDVPSETEVRLFKGRISALTISTLRSNWKYEAIWHDITDNIDSDDVNSRHILEFEELVINKKPDIALKNFMARQTERINSEIKHLENEKKNIETLVNTIIEKL